MSGFKIINAGIFTTIQDKGRFGFSSIGVTNSGVMDEYAYFINSMLLENENPSVLEISFSGFKLEACKDTFVAITGGDFSFCINGEYKKPWAVYKIKKGDKLEFNKKLSGMRVYLGVKGGFEIKKEYGSSSTTIKEGLGGFEGKALNSKDSLDFKECKSFAYKRLKKKYIPKYEDELTLRVLLSYQKDEFEKSEKEKFFKNEFLVSNEANRMGIKLDGEKITPNKSGIISEGIAFGSIQIPSDGRPIILLKDRQTIGGYVKIGVVLSIDCFKLSQAKTGTKIRFEELSVSEAQGKVREFYDSIK